MKHCCRIMERRVATPEETLATLEKRGVSRAGLPDPPEPLVTHTGLQGIYAIGHVAIFYCPWCGTKLPEFSIEKARELGHEINEFGEEIVDPDRNFKLRHYRTTKRTRRASQFAD
jgi:hypothetical protein